MFIFRIQVLTLVRNHMLNVLRYELLTLTGFCTLLSN